MYTSEPVSISARPLSFELPTTKRFSALRPLLVLLVPAEPLEYYKLLSFSSSFMDLFILFKLIGWSESSPSDKSSRFTLNLSFLPRSALFLPSSSESDWSLN